jgi:hypothetical protein
LQESGEFDAIARRHTEGCEDVRFKIAAECAGTEMRGLPQADRWRRRLSGHGLTARDVPKSLQPSPQPEGQHEQRDAEQSIRAI